MTSLSQFRNAEMILPGKGGAGKTLVSTLLAISLSRKYNCALLDVDIITPNLAQATGFGDKEPVYSTSRKQLAFSHNDNLRVFSVETFFVDNAGIRLGVKECERLLQECLEDVDWGSRPIDYLILDMPASQSDPIKALRRLFPKNLYGIGVTTPKLQSMSNLERTLFTCYDLNIKILGVIANMVGAEMHGYVPRCGCGCGQPFYPNNDRGDGSEVREFTERMKCDYLGSIKHDPDLGYKLDVGTLTGVNNGAIATAVRKVERQNFWGKLRGG
jgi:Mrp family chromosome partitioning ATPase